MGQTAPAEILNSAHLPPYRSLFNDNGVVAIIVQLTKQAVAKESDNTMLILQ